MNSDIASDKHNNTTETISPTKTLLLGKAVLSNRMMITLTAASMSQPYRWSCHQYSSTECVKDTVQ